MKPLFKSILKIIQISTMLLMCFAVSSFAATGDPIPEPDPSTRTDVTVNIKSPELYEGDLEFYCGTETFYIHVKSGETLTSATYNVEKGSYKIGFLDPNDISDSFKISYDDHLDTNTKSKVDVVIDYADSVKDNNEDWENEGGDLGIEESSVQPAEYDFSEGQASGTIAISCAQYGSIDATVFKLMGNKIYEITLDAEHDFKANVHLPAGTYKELTSIDVTPNELATISSGLTFAWGHRDKTYFGNNYTVTANSFTDISDLYIKMNYQGDMREVDDSILMQTKIRDNYTDIVNERRDEFVNDNISSEYPTIAAQETSAPAIANAVEKTVDIRKYIAFGAVGLLAIIGITVIVIKRRKQ